jgi:hypothetical protein
VPTLGNWANVNRFFIGLHHPSVAWPFLGAMISINALIRRQTDFRVNDWILDSGAFSQLSKNGQWQLSVAQYARQIQRWNKCGNLVAAVCQDLMCERFILEKTGLSVEEHQAQTIERYLELVVLAAPVYVMPVLQGYKPQEYVSHLRQYGNLLASGAWVGVGSVCKRNGNPDAIEDVLLAIKSERGDLKLHGFGLKWSALERATIRAILESSDSMAWSDAARKEGRHQNDPREALKYCAKVQELLKQPLFIQKQLFECWGESIS